MSDPDRRHPNVVNVAEAPSFSREAGTRFGASARRLGLAAGGRQLGCTHYEVPPGRAAMPAHFHCVNEEAIFVLAGEGTLRLGDARVPVRAGDWIALPVGPDHAHRLENTGADALRYLCVSTMSSGEVCGYPDSKKIGAFGSPDGGGPGGTSWVFLMAPESAGVDYMHGEDVG